MGRKEETLQKLTLSPLLGRKGYLFNSKIIFPETATVTLKDLVLANICTVIENRSGDCYLGNGNGNFQINNFGKLIFCGNVIYQIKNSVNREIVL